MTSRHVTVLLVDDHPVVREGYRRLLEDSGRIRVVAQVATADEAVEHFTRFAPNVVVMDIALRGVSGIEATRRILARSAEARVLVFSMYEDVVFARRALDAGAAGYVTKGSAPRVLVEAVQALAAGRQYLSADVAHAFSAGAPAHGLTARELEILGLLLQGYSVASIATQLGLNEKTVANHQSAIRQKLGAETAPQLFRTAMRLGLIPPL
jgi:two-component system, NarL family, invasion response regulator UvrY